jgi:gas vesicle protein
MFGLIKNLFSGILSFFSGLLGGKKKSEQNQSDTTAIKTPATATVKTRKGRGYFMELDESQEAKQAIANGVQAVKETAANAVQSTKDATQRAKETVATVAQPAQEKLAQNSDTSTNGKAPKAEPNVELVQTAKGVKPEPAKASAKKILEQPQTESTFAPKYLTPSSNNGRRRPGPNMNPFLDMARQVKTPG